jgi:hypothetical protein
VFVSNEERAWKSPAAALERLTGSPPAKRVDHPAMVIE